MKFVVKTFALFILFYLVNGQDIQDQIINIFEAFGYSPSCVANALATCEGTAPSGRKHYDCCDVLRSGRKKSGVYKIYLSGCSVRYVEAYCDMDTDGGGWTVFLTRNKTSYESHGLNFSRVWKDYKLGFGKANAEYWIGNEVLHLLTSSRNHVMRMDARNKIGQEAWGKWGNFEVGSETSNYRVTISTFDQTSSIADGFTNTSSKHKNGYMNGLEFTTIDRDNDLHNESNCAVGKGGWWFNDCAYYHNPTGLHVEDLYTGIYVYPWWELDATNGYAEWLQMKVRPEFCN